MMENRPGNAQRVRTITGIIIMLVIAAYYLFRPGSYLRGDLYLYYYSYASACLEIQ